LTRICDYEGSKYRTEFWENQDRAYEDAVERIALEKLLPPKGDKLIEIGAGFGRLVDMYQGYKQIILVDYARTQLEEAQNYLGNDKRITYVVADVYNLPFVDNLFSTLTMIRVMHHLVNVPEALQELQRIIAPNGTAIIEHASKFNLKSIFRWAARRQEWNPFDPDPIEFVELNFNFHPAWMRDQFNAAGLTVKNTRTLSHYRINALKKLLPTSLLVKMDGLAQNTGNLWQLTPSIFLQARAEKTGQSTTTGFFNCPKCKSALPNLPQNSSGQDCTITCSTCQSRWSFEGGIYNFKTPLEKPA